MCHPWQFFFIVWPISERKKNPDSGVSWPEVQSLESFRCLFRPDTFRSEISSNSETVRIGTSTCIDVNKSIWMHKKESTAQIAWINWYWVSRKAVELCVFLFIRVFVMMYNNSTFVHTIDKFHLVFYRTFIMCRFTVTLNVYKLSHTQLSHESLRSGNSKVAGEWAIYRIIDQQTTHKKRNRLELI